MGQTERFNPAVAAARPVLSDPRFIEVHRLGTFPERSLDIDVVFDLMIHDVDIVLSLVNSEVEAIEAVGRAGADRPRRHRERTPQVQQRLHREPHREPHQPRPRPEDPLLSAEGLRLDRLRGAEAGSLAARQGRRPAAGDRRRGSAGRARRAAQARARRLRRGRQRRAARRWSPARTAAAPSRWPSEIADRMADRNATTKTETEDHEQH